MCMTEEQLIVNINRSRQIAGNKMWYAKVREQAYMDMTRHNDLVNHYKQIKALLKAEDLDPTQQCYKGFNTKYYNDKGHYVLFTKYSKTPRYRSFRQQCAITNRTLEKDLHDKLQQRIQDEIKNYKFKQLLDSTPKDIEDDDLFIEFDDPYNWLDI